MGAVFNNEWQELLEPESTHILLEHILITVAQQFVILGKITCYQVAFLVAESLQLWLKGRVSGYHLL